MTRRRRFYAFLLAATGLGVVAVAVAPTETLVILSALVPLSIISAIVAVLYLRSVYIRQRVPRSRFFRMLLEMFGGLIVIGGWVAYLTVARLTERAALAGTIDWALPAPSPIVSSPISALIVIAVFTAPIRFAYEVYRVRKATQHEGALDRESSDPRSMSSQSS